MNEHVGGNPLERLVARMIEFGGSEPLEIAEVSAGDPLERLGALISAAHDLSVRRDDVSVGGVLGELLERIESARNVEAIEQLGLREADSDDPRVTIARWIADERAALGSVPAMVRVGDRVELPASYEKQAGGVEAAVGRAVLAMVGERPLSGKSRKKAVEMLALGLEDPSVDTLQAVFRILIADE